MKWCSNRAEVNKPVTMTFPMQHSPMLRALPSHSSSTGRCTAIRKPALSGRPPSRKRAASEPCLLGRTQAEFHLIWPWLKNTDTKWNPGRLPFKLGARASCRAERRAAGSRRTSALGMKGPLGILLQENHHQLSQCTCTCFAPSSNVRPLCSKLPARACRSAWTKTTEGPEAWPSRLSGLAERLDQRRLRSQLTPATQAKKHIHWRTSEVSIKKYHFCCRKRVLGCFGLRASARPGTKATT